MATHNNPVYDPTWDDDERGPVRVVRVQQHRDVSYEPIGHAVMKAIAQSGEEVARSMLWNEVEWRNWAYDYPPSEPDEEAQEATQEGDTVQPLATQTEEHNAGCYESLVKNTGAYA